MTIINLSYNHPDKSGYIGGITNNLKLGFE